MVDDGLVGESGAFFGSRGLGDVAGTVDPYLDYYLALLVGVGVRRGKRTGTTAC